MTVTKVKPTVVKHIMPDEVMSIYDIKVSFLFQQKGSENIYWLCQVEFYPYLQQTFLHPYRLI